MNRAERRRLTKVTEKLRQRLSLADGKTLTPEQQREVDDARRVLAECEAALRGD